MLRCKLFRCLALLCCASLFCGRGLFGQVSDERIGEYLQALHKSADKITQRQIDLFRVFGLDDNRDAIRAERILADKYSINEYLALRRSLKTGSVENQKLRAEMQKPANPRIVFLEALIDKPPGLGGWDGPGILAGDGLGMNPVRLKSNQGTAWLIPSVRVNSHSTVKASGSCVTRVVIPGNPKAHSVTYRGQGFDELTACPYDASAGRAVAWLDRPLGGDFVLPTGLMVQVAPPMVARTGWTADIVGRMRPTSVARPQPKTAVHPYEILQAYYHDEDRLSGWYELTSTSPGYPEGKICFDTFEVDPFEGAKSVIPNAGVTGITLLGTTADHQTAFVWRLGDGIVSATTVSGETTELGTLMSTEDLETYQELDRNYRSDGLSFFLLSNKSLNEDELASQVGIIALMRRNILRSIVGCVCEGSPVAAYVSPADHAVKVCDFRHQPVQRTSHPLPPGWTLQSCGLRSVAGHPILITVERPLPEDKGSKGRIRACKVSADTAVEPVILYEFEARKNACWGTVLDGERTIFGAATNALFANETDQADVVELCLGDVLE